MYILQLIVGFGYNNIMYYTTTRQMLKALWGEPDLSHIQKNSIVSLLLTYVDMQFRWLSTQPHLVY